MYAVVYMDFLNAFTLACNTTSMLFTLKWLYSVSSNIPFFFFLTKPKLALADEPAVRNGFGEVVTCRATELNVTSKDTVLQKRWRE